MSPRDRISRRDFVRNCGASLISARGSGSTRHRLPGPHTLLLNQNWLFGKIPGETALQPNFDDSALSPITLPHCVSRLSWRNWDPAGWQQTWIYRKHFTVPREFMGPRVLLEFDSAMIAATPVINGHALPQHLGGFLPFRYEISGLLKEAENVLAVAVDSGWKSVPPEGSPKGPSSIDYLLPGGITGSVRLRAVPGVFISDVFAKPVSVLSSGRRLDITCTINVGGQASGPPRIEATLWDGARLVRSASTGFNAIEPGELKVPLSLTDVDDLKLWDVDAPYLYELAVTLFLHGEPTHEYRTRIGFREARFELDGFFLNGRRVQLFGLNRHELYPYAGRAMPNRVLRRDAHILRRRFNCNVVRCSHYPQSKAFLDACDEFGLLVWEEIPGWQYVGDAAWQDLAVRDVQEMVRRDRNHPCVIVWGVRINESPNNPAFYARTKEAAKSLDDSRPTSGSMVHYSTRDWFQDVFAFDDYHCAAPGTVGLRDPLPGVPFFFSEAVGQFNYDSCRGFDHKYRRAADVRLQQEQALLHAQAHDKAAANKRCGGLIAWCAFDYASLINSYAGVKYPGVADIFRIPKLGASFYLAQVDPKIRPVIEPNFYWDFGPATAQGPDKHVAIFSNCDRLELKIDGKPHAVLRPDRAGFPHLKYPPFFADLAMDRAAKPELCIDGYVGEHLVLSRSFSSDITADQFLLFADESELLADGSDSTRIVFRVADKYGAARLFAGGKVAFEIDGPGLLIGDNSFDLADSGGAGAVWVRTLPGRAGRINIEAQHSSLGKKFIGIRTVVV